MTILSKIIVSITAGTIISCSSFTFYRSYEYTFMLSKHINFSSGKWLLNPSPIKLDLYEKTFKSLLGKRMVTYPDINNTLEKKHLIPEIKKSPTKQKLKLLRAITSCDYFVFCISSNTSKKYHSETTTYQSIIEVYDLRNMDLIFKGTCSVVEEFSENTLWIDLQKSTLKKLLRKIH